MRPLLLLAAGLVLAALPASAASPDMMSGLYDGEGACLGGAVQVMIWIDVDQDYGVTGSVKVTPLKGSSAKGSGEIKVEGVLDKGVQVELNAAEGGATVFTGDLIEDKAGDMTLVGNLANGGCKGFTLALDPMSQM